MARGRGARFGILRMLSSVGGGEITNTESMHSFAMTVVTDPTGSSGRAILASAHVRGTGSPAHLGEGGPKPNDIAPKMSGDKGVESSPQPLANVDIRPMI